MKIDRGTAVVAVMLALCLGLAGILSAVDAVRSRFRADPTRDRLATGTEAVSFDADPKQTAVALRDLPRFAVILVGLKVRVIADEQPDAAPGDDREVRVIVLEGEHRDLVASMWRRQLRPIPAR
jgi:hypothetical protein